MPKKKKKTIPKKVLGVVDNSVGKFDNDPYFIKKAEEAKALIRRVGLPKGFPSFE